MASANSTWGTWSAIWARSPLSSKRSQLPGIRNALESFSHWSPVSRTGLETWQAGSSGCSPAVVAEVERWPG